MRGRIKFCGALFLVLYAISTVAQSSLTGHASEISKPRANENGLASYYADKYHGRPTASGEMHDQHKLTAAHPTLPFGTRVKVTRTGNNRSVIVRINDRGPFKPGRIIDLSRGAAAELGMLRDGLAQVSLEIVK